MPQPGDYVPAPDIGPTAIRLVDPVACPNGHPFGPGWSRGYFHCSCAGGAGHPRWGCGACGWSLIAAPHDPNHKPASPY